MPISSTGRPHSHHKAAATHDGGKKHADAAKASKDPSRGKAPVDAFEPAAAKKATTATLRPAGDALNFLAAYDARLGLSAADRAAKAHDMKGAALSFFRAAPALFVSDLQGAWKDRAQLSPRPAPSIAIDGDAHLGNFGTFRGPDGKAVWGLNDHDQSGTGSPAVDLERFSTSLVLQARAAGLSAADQKKVVESFGKQYANTIDDLAHGKGTSDGAWLTATECKKPVDSLIHDADQAKRKTMLADLVSNADGANPKFTRGPRLADLSPGQSADVRAALAAYDHSQGPTPEVARPLHVLDTVARLGSGGSSYGLPRYWALVETSKPGHLPVIIELKSAPPTPLGDHAGATFDARKMVANQKAMSGLANPITGSTTMGATSLLVREYEPEKNTLALDKVSSKADLTALAEAAAKVLARAHGSSRTQAAAVETWLGGKSPDDAIARLTDFATGYAQQVASDYAAFRN